MSQLAALGDLGAAEVDRAESARDFDAAFPDLYRHAYRVAYRLVGPQEAKDLQPHRPAVAPARHGRRPDPVCRCRTHAREYLGSAKVSLQSDHAGESIGGDYDVYDSPAAAAAAFAQADSNFSATPQAGATTREQLSPSVGAFCGQQAPPNAFTCWFVRGPTTGLVDATIPASADGGDTHALLQALLNHLIAVGG